MDILTVLGSVFSSVWALFGVEYPGLGVSFGTFLIAMIIIRISLSLIHAVFDLGGSGTSYRSNSARNPKISDKRKDDAF